MTTSYLPHPSSYETLTTSQRAAIDHLGLHYGPNNPRDVRGAAHSCYNHRLLIAAADGLVALGQPNNAFIIHKRIRKLA